jgi:N-methylhydantoinase A
MRLAVDIGGTFTDVTAFDDASGRVTLGKALTTPSDLVDGIMSAISGAGASVADATSIVHGSTMVINALL